MTGENIGSVFLDLKLDDKNYAKALSGVNKETDALQKKMKNLGSSFSNLGNKLTLGVTLPIAGLVTAGINYNAQLEQFEASLGVLLGSQNKAKKLLNTLKQMAKTTPFETTDLIDATQTMLAFGISAEDTMDALNMLGDVSMGNRDKLKGLTLAFSQVRSTGRLMGQDLLQMINQGFNPLQIISQKTGRSMADLKKDMENGAISADMVTEAFRHATSEGGLFFGAMDKQSQTTTGKISTLKDSFKEATGELTESLLPIFSKVVTKLTEFANWFGKLDENTQNTITTMGLLAAGSGPLLKLLGIFAKNPSLIALSAIATLVLAIYNDLKRANAEYGKLAKAMGEGGGTSGKSTFGAGAGFGGGGGTLSNDSVGRFAKGINVVPKDMMAQIHAGEAIVPKKYNPALNNGLSNRNQTLYATIQLPDIQLDGRSIVQNQMPYITKNIKLAGGNQ